VNTFPRLGLYICLTLIITWPPRHLWRHRKC